MVMLQPNPVAARVLFLQLLMDEDRPVTPEILVQEVISTLESRYGATVKHNEGNTENVSFQLPKELR